MQLSLWLSAVLVTASASAVYAQQAPVLPFEVVPDFLKYSSDMNLGEVLGIAVNSKGHIVIVNHPGNANAGPLYGGASTQLLEFDENGKFLKELGKGVYGLGYAHSVRFDKYDNMWVVDKGTMSIMRFNPQGYVTMNLGRKEEGPDEHRYPGGRGGAAPVPQEGYYNGPTDIAWDSSDNMYISDGYQNSRVAKVDKHGVWIKQWGTRGTENGQFRLPHNIQVDRQNNVYVADRNNNRIQVFDSDGNWERNILLNLPWDKTKRPTL